MNDCLSLLSFDFWFFFAVDSVLVYPVLYSLWCCAFSNIVINMCAGMVCNSCV